MPLFVPEKHTRRERDGEKEKPGCQSSSRNGETLIVSEIGRKKLRAFFFSDSRRRLCFGSSEVVDLIREPLGSPAIYTLCELRRVSIVM